MILGQYESRQQHSRPATQQADMPAVWQERRLVGQQVGETAGWQVSSVSGQQAGRLAGRLSGRPAGWQSSRLAFRPAGRMSGRKAGRSAGCHTADFQESRLVGQAWQDCSKAGKKARRLAGQLDFRRSDWQCSMLADQPAYRQEGWQASILVVQEPGGLTALRVSRLAGQRDVRPAGRHEKRTA
jgi:hypothetical protein